jgi:hypothetical protein
MNQFKVLKIMKIIQGQDLVSQLRKLSDKVSKRLWIAVPYIGSPTTVRKILGKEWFDRPSVSVKLLTDTSDLSCIDTETIQHFYNRGQVKTLKGLHAKVYIIDETCLVTSANLTNTAFSKRYEIGVILNSIGTEKVIEKFKTWWQQSTYVKPETLKKISKTKNSCKEEKSDSLPQLFDLPTDPGSFAKNLSKQFLNYDRLVADYEDFATKYSSIHRLWKSKPIYLEIDGLFNYLYHHAPKRPSKKYTSEAPRSLTEKMQLKEIEKWAASYKEWNQTIQNNNDIGWRIKNSKNLKRLLSPEKVKTLKKNEIEEILSSLNSLNSYPINRAKIMSNNTLRNIRRALDNLVNGEEQLAVRMNKCNSIKYLGTSSMNEIIGFTNPNKYPLINRNSNSGLRFFGYQIKAYN